MEQKEPLHSPPAYELSGHSPFQAQGDPPQHDQGYPPSQEYPPQQDQGYLLPPGAPGPTTTVHLAAVQPTQPTGSDPGPCQLIWGVINIVGIICCGCIFLCFPIVAVVFASKMQADWRRDERAMRQSRTMAIIFNSISTAIIAIETIALIIILAVYIPQVNRLRSSQNTYYYNKYGN